MNGFTVRRTALALALLILLVAAWTTLPVALAHGVRCPVCGMPVDDHTAQWKTTWKGETYHFCMEADQTAFTNNPERYAGVLKLTRKVGERVVVATVRPRAPAVGDTVRVHVQVAPMGSDGMSPVESETLAITSMRALVWVLDRSRPPEARAIRMQPQDDRTHAVALLATAPLPLRLRLEVLLRTGESLLAHLDLPVAARGKPAAHEAADHEHGEEGEAYEPQPQGGDSEAPPSPDGPLTMEAQHLSMKVMARRWEALARELDADDPGEDRALRAIEDIEGWRRVMPRFTLHKFAEQKAEYDALTAAFGERLDALRDEVRDGRWAEARAAWRQVDANDCTRCHVKFRWAITTDLQDFPDLTRGAGHGH